MSARRKTFLDAVFAARFEKTYAKLPHDRQGGVDKVVLALIKQEPTPGMRVKPIQPEKHYSEARISAGDRLVFRVDGGTVAFVDIVTHDDIERYGKLLGL